MIPNMVSAGLLLVVIVCLVMLGRRHRFLTHLDALEAALRKTERRENARADLPPEVVALAERLGARTVDIPAFIALRQAGEMWVAPGAKPKAFIAEQTIRVDTPGFLWRAQMGSVVVADYYVERTGGLEVMLFGALRIAYMVGGAAANQGEALRYLAELPWCPDAILANRLLDWTVIDTKTIKVATGSGASRGEVTFELDDAGLVARASAPSRGYKAVNGRMTNHAWHCRLWDYQRVDDRLIPMQGEAAWALNAGDFVYWRGRLLPA